MKLLNQCSLYSQHQHNQGHWKWENEWKVATEVHAIQQDTYSCGVFVMKVYVAITTILFCTLHM